MLKQPPPRRVKPQAPIVARPRKPFRFGLRSLFVLLAAVGVLSAAARSLVNNDPSMFLGIGAFCYGAIVGIPCYVFVGSLMVLTTKTTRGQRAGEIFAAVVGATAWIAFILISLFQWPQLCVAQSLVVIGIAAWVVRWNWKAEEGPSPESSLARLTAVKRGLREARDADKQL